MNYADSRPKLYMQEISRRERFVVRIGLSVLRVEHNPSRNAPRRPCRATATCASSSAHRPFFRLFGSRRPLSGLAAVFESRRRYRNWSG